MRIEAVLIVVMGDEVFRRNLRAWYLAMAGAFGRGDPGIEELSKLPPTAMAEVVSMAATFAAAGRSYKAAAIKRPSRAGARSYMGVLN